MSLIAGNSTIVYYVAPDGTVFFLSGGADAGTQGMWLGQGPEGLGDIEVAAIFDAAARDEGEDYVGSRIDHGQIDIPVHILGNTVDHARLLAKWFKSKVRRETQGYLCIYTNVQGWRSVAVRRGSMTPAIGFDPAITRGCTYDVMLLVDRPHARTADSTAKWSNSTLAGKGDLYLHPSDEVDGWPKFIFTGPGELRLMYADMDVTIPAAIVGEEILIDTDQVRPTLRATTINGVKRNLWPLMRGKHFPNPCPADEVTRVKFEVKGGNANTALWGTLAQRHEGLL
ncbi:hypothetical protein [Rhodococcus sp. ARP2]|uniref:hypothetical protein n=1 Tax=Rhodococcus sp. ARP2 TaxID=1661385 RepID=UPI00064C297D|nr:hypothetical protein [Rhodococcus sp. ARP2]